MVGVGEEGCDRANYKTNNKSLNNFNIKKILMKSKKICINKYNEFKVYEINKN